MDEKNKTIIFILLYFITFSLILCVFFLYFALSFSRKRNSIDSGRIKGDGGSTNGVITIAMNNINDIDVDVEKKKNVHKYQTFRRILAQVSFNFTQIYFIFGLMIICSLFFAKYQLIACSIKNILIVDGGITMAFPTIVIPALTGLNAQINPDEFMHITPVQASWLGKLLLYHLNKYCLVSYCVPGTIIKSNPM